MGSSPFGPMQLGLTGRPFVPLNLMALWEPCSCTPPDLDFDIIWVKEKGAQVGVFE